MSILMRYLSTRLVLSTFGVATGLSAIFEIIDLADTTADILKTGTGIGGLAYYVVMRLPSFVTWLLPLSVLIASLIMLALLARNSEITAMRNAGLSTVRLITLLMPATIVIVVTHYAIAEGLTGQCEERLAGWWSVGLSDPGSYAYQPVWLKVDGSIVSIEHVRDGGRELHGLTIYQRDANSVVTKRIIASSAVFHAGVWTLADAVSTPLPARLQPVDVPANGEWISRLRPMDVMAALTPNGYVSALKANAVLSGERIATAADVVYQTARQRVFAAPAGNMIMLLLAIPVGFADPRRGGYERPLLIGLGAGLLFMFVDGLLATLGSAGVVNPIVASWLPFTFFCLFALLRLRRLENTANRR